MEQLGAIREEQTASRKTNEEVRYTYPSLYPFNLMSAHDS